MYIYIYTCTRFRPESVSAVSPLGVHFFLARYLSGLLSLDRGYISRALFPVLHVLCLKREF